MYCTCATMTVIITRNTLGWVCLYVYVCARECLSVLGLCVLQQLVLEPCKISVVCEPFRIHFAVCNLENCDVPRIC